MSALLIITARILLIFEFIIFIRCILSFIQPDPSNPLVNFIYSLTDPLMDAVRKSLPFLVAGGIDLSPIVIIFLLDITRQYLIRMA